MESMMVSLFSGLFACAIFGLIGMAVGDLAKKRNGMTGFLLGFFLGPIGWIIVALLPPAPEKDEAPAKAESSNDPTKYVLWGLGIGILIMVALLGFAHVVTQY